MNNAKLLNSYIANSPAGAAFNSVRNTASSFGNRMANAANSFRNTVTNRIGNVAGNLAVPATQGAGIPWMLIGIVGLLIVIITLMVVFYEDIKKGLPASIYDIFYGPKKDEAPESPPVVTAPPTNVEPVAPASMVESILPGKKQVFNISSNRYVYDDAEPLCRALGAELATYDQVKAAFDSGADWCNYGWTKGQLAMYPTQKATYDKLQLGPEGQRLACGRPGLNGGYFDNPDLRFGVNCYGIKPSQSQHDSAEESKGTPISPDALEFDKKVALYKSEADHIGILPFRDGAWSE